MTEAAAATLVGEAPAPGRLPVNLKSMPVGHGLGATDTSTARTDTTGSR